MSQPLLCVRGIAGDSSTPRSMRKTSSSGASGPLAHSITIGSSTSMPTPFDDSAGLSWSGSGNRQHFGQGGGLMGGLRDLLPSMQDELSAGLTAVGSEGAGLQAPSFSEASKSFAAARSSTWHKPVAGAATVGPAGVGDAVGGDGAKQAAAEGADGSEQQELVRLLFAKYNPTSSNYTGLDVEVVLRLSTLVFYCNRPTVAALMVFGTDLGAVNALLAAPSAEAQVRSRALILHMRASCCVHCAGAAPWPSVCSVIMRKLVYAVGQHRQLNHANGH